MTEIRKELHITTDEHFVSQLDLGIPHTSSCIFDRISCV